MLTDAKLRRAKEADGAVADGTVAVLYFFPTKVTGRGKWILRFTSPATGKRRDMGLGNYPEVSLGDARSAAGSARQRIAEGTDPIEHRKSTALLASAELEVPSFEKAARAVHQETKLAFKNGKHVDQWINTLDDYVFPQIGNRRVDELRPVDFADALRPIWLTKPETASRVKQRCDKVMKWCAARGYIVASPLPVVDNLLPKQPGKRERVIHHPAVPWGDLPDFFRSEFCEKQPTTGRNMLELLILTAARSGEIRGMNWSEIDLSNAVWTIPATRMKAKQSHRVPLTPRCVDLLKTLKTEGASGLVFQTSNGTPLTDMAMTKLLRTAGTKSDVEGRIATAHGFRSSFRDWASEKGYVRDLAEKALAHTIKNQTEAAYHHTNLLEPRREMMLAWEKRCISRMSKTR
jgi:integrase